MLWDELGLAPQPGSHSEDVREQGLGASSSIYSTSSGLVKEYSTTLTMPMFSKIFHKRSTKAPEQATPVSSVPEQATPGLSASGPSANTSPIRLSADKIFKDTIMFASLIANNAGIPWVKIVSESIIGIIQRLDVSGPSPSLPVNYNQPHTDHEIKRGSLGRFAKWYQGIPLHRCTQRAAESRRRASRAFHNVRFHRASAITGLTDGNAFYYSQVQSIQLPVTQNSFVRFLSVQETRDIITRLRRNLDSAVQLFQVCFKPKATKKHCSLTKWILDWSSTYFSWCYGPIQGMESQHRK